MTTVADILTRCAEALYDQTNIVYSKEMLLDHLNNANASIVQVDSKAYMPDAIFTLAAGTKQNILDNYTALVACRYNVSSDGSVRGRATTVMSLDSMDAARPDWHASPPSHTIRQYGIDPREPRVFYVWPPAFAGDCLQATFYGAPDPVGLDDDSPLPSTYDEAIFCFVCFHALMRRDPNTNTQVSSMYQQMFLRIMGVDPATIRAVQVKKPDSPFKQEQE